MIEITCGVTLLDALIDADGFADQDIFECEHSEHWAQVSDTSGAWLDWDDAPALCRWENSHIGCLLAPGHSGDHAFDWPVTHTIDCDWSVAA